MTGKPEDRRAKMSALMRRTDARKAHPSLEHILPVYVAAGAAGSDAGEQLWTMPEKSLSWAQYRFGKVAAASEGVASDLGSVNLASDSRHA